jgi:aspartate racemase
VIRELAAAGAEAVGLGCTEITLLVALEDVPEVPLLDSTALHVERIVDRAVA